MKVECVLKCCATGKEIRETKFSKAQWGDITDEFMAHVAMLSDKKLKVSAINISVIYNTLDFIILYDYCDVLHLLS